jgi:hypothetical protein
MKSKLDQLSGLLSIIAIAIAVITFFIDLSDVLRFSPELIGIIFLIAGSFLSGMYSSRIVKRLRKLPHAPRVFLSYRSEDRSIALEIANALRNSGAKVWDAYEQIQPGEEWVAQIDEALADTDTFVAVLSDVPSEWISHELELAKNYSLPIIPVLTRKFILPTDLGKLSYVDLSVDKEDGINRVVEAST